VKLQELKNAKAIYTSVPISLINQPGIEGGDKSPERGVAYSYFLGIVANTIIQDLAGSSPFTDNKMLSDNR